MTHNMQGEGRFNFQTAFYTDQSVLYRLLLNKDLCVWIKCSNSGPSVEIFFNLTSWQWNVKWRKMLIWNKINVHLDYKTGIWAGVSATKEISYLSWGGGERDGVEECLCCDSLVSKIEKMVNFILVCRVSSTSVNAT